MAQRNPMNQRYQGDGPGGQTRKSASSLKPASDAAASVRVKGKPSTSAEKKKAEAERKERERKKEEERLRRQARAEQARRTAEAKARLARGEMTPEEVEAIENATIQIEPPRKKSVIAEERDREIALRTNPEYRKWRRL